MFRFWAQSSRTRGNWGPDESRTMPHGRGAKTRWFSVPKSSINGKAISKYFFFQKGKVSLKKKKKKLFRRWRTNKTNIRKWTISIQFIIVKKCFERFFRNVLMLVKMWQSLFDRRGYKEIDFFFFYYSFSNLLIGFEFRTVILRTGGGSVGLRHEHVQRESPAFRVPLLAFSSVRDSDGPYLDMCMCGKM